MSRRPTYLVLSLLLCAGLLSGSTEDEIRKRQAELQSIRDQIHEFEERIIEQRQSEKVTLEILDTYDRKATLLRKLIRKLRGAEAALQRRIESTRKTLAKLEEQLAFLKKHYASYVSSVYKTGRMHDLELLLSSTSVNQFYVRTEYLKRFTAQRKKDVAGIMEKKREIEQIQAQLQQELSEERRLIAEKGAEEDRLAALAEDRREVLVQIRKDRRLVQREIDRQMRAAKEIENVIAQLIEADRIRRESEAEAARKGRIPQPPPTEGSFEARKGKLRWPVAEGTVVAKFGNQRHPTLKTITQNTGIDIAVKAGSPVVAVADGEVARIWWLPSYGNLMILNHYNGYRTVYTHLADINVVEGQKINENDVIATSGEALEGARLHFEVWKGQEKQNPESWLIRQ